MFLADAYAALGDYDSAAVWAEKAVEGFPEDPHGASQEIFYPFYIRVLECYKQGKPYHAVFPDEEGGNEK
ncbi:hypothetical protein ACFL5F_06620 [Planctomycetota bacterium]